MTQQSSGQAQTTACPDQCDHGTAYVCFENHQTDEQCLAYYRANDEQICVGPEPCKRCYGVGHVMADEQLAQVAQPVTMQWDREWDESRAQTIYWPEMLIDANGEKVMDVDTDMTNAQIIALLAKLNS